jgi:hypothetical protein
VRLRSSVAQASPMGSGSLASAMLESCVGRPSTSRRTMLTGERTDKATPTPCSARSSAISAPVLPMPTTSTLWPLKGAALR